MVSDNTPCIHCTFAYINTQTIAVTTEEVWENSMIFIFTYSFLQWPGFFVTLSCGKVTLFPSTGKRTGMETVCCFDTSDSCHSNNTHKILRLSPSLARYFEVESISDLCKFFLLLLLLLLCPVSLTSLSKLAYFFLSS